MTFEEAADRLAIRELVDANARCADRRDCDGQMALFTEDARFLVFMDAKAPTPSQTISGIDPNAGFVLDVGGVWEGTSPNTQGDYLLPTPELQASFVQDPLFMCLPGRSSDNDESATGRPRDCPATGRTGRRTRNARDAGFARNRARIAGSTDPRPDPTIRHASVCAGSRRSSVREACTIRRRPRIRRSE